MQYPVDWPGKDEVISSGTGGGGSALPESGEDGGQALPEQEAIRGLLGKYLG